MSPEEKARIEAETQKLKAETASLQKKGWGKPASWLPMLAAVAAIATSMGQFQYSSLKEREASLKARQQVFEAKIKENQLFERNNKLEIKYKALTKDIQKSTSEILLLREETTKANEQLIKVAQEKDTDGTLLARVEKDITKRTKQVENIVASAENRNLEIQIQSLVWQMNSDVKSTRLNAVAKLIENYNANNLAISYAIELIAGSEFENISPSGRINALVYLRNTELASWDEGLKNKVKYAINTLKESALNNKLYIGPQTESAIERLESMLK